MKTIEVNTHHIINQSFLGRKLLFPLLIIGCFLFAKSTLAESDVEFEDVMPVQNIESVLAGPVPTDLIVTHNGLEWVYASPCSGGCSQPDPSFQSTGSWRFATDTELENRPDWHDFAPNGYQNPCSTPFCRCAAAYFDPIHTHCDLRQYRQGLVTSQHESFGFLETVYVREIGGGAVDTDGDGIPDDEDACPLDADNDIDADGVCGDVDNCPNISNPNQEDVDEDSLGDACDTCPNDADNDIDSDGVCGDVDWCADTFVPENVLIEDLLPNHFALINNDNLFDTWIQGELTTETKKGESFTVEETAGCSCEQIVEAQHLGINHSKGCPIGIMRVWVQSLGD